MPRADKEALRKADALIKRDYPKVASNIYELLNLGYKRKWINYRAHMIGVSFLKRKPWQQKHDDILREKYPICGTEIKALLKLGFTKSAIKSRAVRFGLKKYNSWLSSEIKILERQYQMYGAEIPALLKRHSKSQIRSKAHSLNIKVDFSLRKVYLCKN